MKCFKYSNFITHLCKVTCTCKSWRTWTYNSYLLALLFCWHLWCYIVLSCPVSYKSFKLTDRYGFALNTSYTLTLALCFLWTYTATYCWKCWRLSNNLICFFKIAFFYIVNEFRNIDWYWTSLNASCILTIKTTCCFFLCLFCIITKANFIKILVSYIWSLFPYRNFLHNIHYIYLFSID